MAKIGAPPGGVDRTNGVCGARTPFGGGFGCYPKSQHGASALRGPARVVIAGG
jgi:hypothetical protein